jgi:uncharacterized RDD family membrane protein YckC
MKIKKSTIEKILTAMGYPFRIAFAILGLVFYPIAIFLVIILVPDSVASEYSFSGLIKEFSMDYFGGIIKDVLLIEIVDEKST